MKMYLIENKDKNPIRPENLGAGLMFPYQTKAACFPVMIPESDKEGWAAFDLVEAQPGQVGCHFRHPYHIYAIDSEGNGVVTGLVIPDEISPQPMEIDYENPFWKAARAAQDRLKEQTTDDIEGQEEEKVKV